MTNENEALQTIVKPIFLLVLCGSGRFDTLDRGSLAFEPTMSVFSLRVSTKKQIFCMIKNGQKKSLCCTPFMLCLCGWAAGSGGLRGEKQGRLLTTSEPKNQAPGSNINASCLANSGNRRCEHQTNGMLKQVLQLLFFFSAFDASKNCIFKSQFSTKG